MLFGTEKTEHYDIRALSVGKPTVDLGVLHLPMTVSPGEQKCR